VKQHEVPEPRKKAAMKADRVCCCAPSPKPTRRATPPTDTALAHLPRFRIIKEPQRLGRKPTRGCPTSAPNNSTAGITRTAGAKPDEPTARRHQASNRANLQRRGPAADLTLPLFDDASAGVASVCPSKTICRPWEGCSSPPNPQTSRDPGRRVRAKIARRQNRELLYDNGDRGGQRGFAGWMRSATGPGPDIDLPSSER